MHCTVVIPTWNEAPWLPRALAPLLHHPDVANVIVADNASDDETVAIARSAGCIVIKGGRPAASRNRAAACADTPVLAFVDADAIVPPETLRRAVAAIQSDAADLYHCLVVPIRPTRFEAIAYQLVNAWCAVLQYAPRRQGVGGLLVVRRTAFRAVKGFDESIAAGEDADFVRRVGQRFRVQFDRSQAIYVSPRRLRVENPILFALKTVMWTLLRLTSTRVSIASYRWLPYPPELAEVEELSVELKEDSDDTSRY